MKLNELKEYDESMYQKAFEKWNECGPHDDWYEYVKERMKEKGKELGFEIKQVLVKKQ